MSYGPRQPAAQSSAPVHSPGVLRRLLEAVGLGQPAQADPDPRQPYGHGTGRASYAVVQHRRAANRVARRSRRINRRSR